MGMGRDAIQNKTGETGRELEFKTVNELFKNKPRNGGRGWKWQECSHAATWSPAASHFNFTSALLHFVALTHTSVPVPLRVSALLFTTTGEVQSCLVKVPDCVCVSHRGDRAHISTGQLPAFVCLLSRQSQLTGSTFWVLLAATSLGNDGRTPAHNRQVVCTRWPLLC